jgi:hypothetical protein
VTVSTGLRLWLATQISTLDAGAYHDGTVDLSGARLAVHEALRQTDLSQVDKPRPQPRRRRELLAQDRFDLTGEDVVKVLFRGRPTTRLRDA